MSLTKSERQLLIELSNKQHQSRLGKCSSLSPEEYRKLCALTEKNMKK